MAFLLSHLIGFVAPDAYRRLWSGRKDRVAFSTDTFCFFYLFYPHVGMMIWMISVGLVGLIGWPFGFRWNDSQLTPGTCAMLLLIGCLFSAVFMPVLLGRCRVVVDRSAQTVTDALGLKLLVLPFIPLKRKRTAFADCRAVLLENDSTWIVIAIEFRSRSDTLKMKCASRVAAREWAEEIARMMSLPLVDRTMSPELERQPELLDESLRTRLIRTQAASEVPAAPDNCTGVYSRLPSGVYADFPRPAFKAAGLLRILLGCALAVILTSFYRPAYPRKPLYNPPLEVAPGSRAPSPPSLWPWRLATVTYYATHGIFYLGSISIGMLLIALAVNVATHPKRFQVEAVAEGLVIRRRGMIFSRRFRLPQDMLEELRIEELPAHQKWRVVAVTDRRQVRFPDWLSMSEALYLRDLLVQALVPPQTTTAPPAEKM